MTTSTTSVSTANADTTAVWRRGQLVSNQAGAELMVNIRRTPEIPADGSNNIVTQRIPLTEVFIQGESPADTQGFQWFLVFEKAPGDLGWVREDVLLEHLSAPGPNPDPAPTPDPIPDPPTETQLFFETNTYIVRVLRVQSRLSMNVYNKVTNKTELLGGATVKLPPLETSSSWQTYLAQQNGQVYLARFIPRANTELVISQGVAGAISLQQAGFRAEGVAFIR